MQESKRKRVTRVGSGAYSIYLPKRWIDSWNPQQQKAREVELHFINRSLLIMPVHRDRSLVGRCGNDVARLRACLLSAYVRGFQQALFEPEDGAFAPDAVAAARSFLRHLDERLTPVVGPKAVGFRLQDELPAPFASGGALLQLMVAKVQEVVGLALECVEGTGQPERVLHAARLLADVHEEDLSRLYHQALRLVATLELPLQTVSEFQLLDLVAAELHDMGRQGVNMAQAAVGGLGLSMADLDYPRPELLARIGKPAAASPASRALLRSCAEALRTAQRLLDELAETLAAGGPAPLLDIAARAEAAEARLQQEALAAVGEQWGEPAGRKAATQAAAAFRLAGPAANLLDGLARAAGRAVALAPWGTLVRDADFALPRGK